MVLVQTRLALVNWTRLLAGFLCNLALERLEHRAAERGHLGWSACVSPRRLSCSSRPVNAPQKWAAKTPHFVACPPMLLLSDGSNCGGSSWGTGHDHGTASTRAEPHRHRPPAGYRPQDGAPIHRPRPRAAHLRSPGAATESHGCVPAVSA